MEARLQRALTQRMYLIGGRAVTNGWELRVEGATQTVYKVVLQPKFCSCNCPDYEQRRSICKHIMFAVGRVANHMDILRSMNGSDPGTFVLTDSLDERLTQLIEGVQAEVVGVKSEEKDTEAEELKEEKMFDYDCRICFDELLPTDTLSTCATCKNNLHADCVHKWAASCRRSGNNVSCPFCRAEFSASLTMPKRKRAVADDLIDDDCLAKFQKQKNKQK